MIKKKGAGKREKGKKRMNYLRKVLYSNSDDLAITYSLPKIFGRVRKEFLVTEHALLTRRTDTDRPCKAPILRGNISLCQ